MVVKIFGAAKAFSAGGAAKLLLVDVLMLLQAVLTRELHPTFTTIEQLNVIKIITINYSVYSIQNKNVS
jgi:hypothetical protein